MNSPSSYHALHSNGTLSPGQPVPCLENATIPAADLFLMSGSIIELMDTHG
jgi:hypothetical protein